MRAPEFWYRADGLWPSLLAPAASLYAAADALRHAVAQPATAEAPIVCVGNLVTGGAGKTPIALAIAALAMDAGARVRFLTRGYGGRLAGPVRVDPNAHQASDVGDEPLLLAATAPTWVARNRAAGAAAAATDGADLIIMDDGLQNLDVQQDLRLLVVDGQVGFGNGRVMPAGPLREPIARGLRRAHAVVLMEPDQHDLARGFDLPILRARLEPTEAAARLAHRRVIAFAGIGRPEKFFATLRALGANLVESYPFADHQIISPEDLMALFERALGHDATLVTTEKDYARLPPEARPMVTPVPVTVAWRDEAAVHRLLAPLIPNG